MSDTPKNYPPFVLPSGTITVDAATFYGLARAACALERHRERTDNAGVLWDDSMRTALENARTLGLAPPRSR